MNNKIKFALSTVLALGAVLAAAGCGGGGNSGAQEGKFRVVYYPGGYGSEYLEKFVTEFLAQKKGVDVSQIKSKVDYELIGDADITYGADNYIKVKKKAADLIISNKLAPTYITEGYIEPLDDVFNTEVTFSQTGTAKIKDQYKIPEGYKNHYRQTQYNVGSYHYFGMTWSAIPLSMVYNETLMQKVTHNDKNGTVDAKYLNAGKWQTPPETMEEFKVYLADVGDYDSKLVKFGWTTESSNWFESLYSTWWAEKQGCDVSAVEGQGSFYDFWNLDTPELWKQQGIQDALEETKSFLIKDGKFVNSFQDPTSVEMRAAQTEFAKGNVAVCLTGDFFEKEYQSVIKEYGQTFKMMRVPSIEGAIKKEGERIKYTYVDVNSVAYVPAAGQNKALAKEFLVYTCQEQQCQTFTEMTGGIKPMKYDPLANNPNFAWSEYKKSVINLYNDVDSYLVKFPRNAEKVCPVAIYETIRDSFLMGVDYGSVLTRLKDYTPKQIMIDGGSKEGQVVFKSCYQTAKKQYDETFKSRYNLKY